MKGFTRDSVHSTAIISERARLGTGVTIGPYCVIHDGVEVGDGSTVGPQSILGEPLAAFYGDDTYENPSLTIGAGAVIRSGAIFYAGTTIGEGFECGHRVTIREGCRIGAHCRVGTLTDVQANCTIGDYVRLHSNVFVADQSRLGDFVWVFPHAVLTNDPHPPSNLLVGPVLEDFAAVSAGAVVLPGVTIGRDALVGAAAVVTRDVPAATVVAGVPARDVGPVAAVRSRADGRQVYPWRLYFDRGMPWEGIGYDRWMDERRKNA